MKDITNLLYEAMNNNFGYNSSIISSDIENIPNMWCRLEDDSRRKWYLISETDGKSVRRYLGYLSEKYPVALLYDECPKEVKEVLQEKKILVGEYNYNYSCDKDVLKNYVDEDIIMLDDRFLFDEALQFDEETFLKIYEGVKYINPHNFTFESIK